MICNLVLFKKTLKSRLVGAHYRTDWRFIIRTYIIRCKKIMSDIEMNDMGMEEQELLGQMVTQALLRDSQAAPDASSEWQKLAARMNANSKRAFASIVDCHQCCGSHRPCCRLLHVGGGIHEDKLLPSIRQRRRAYRHRYSR